MTVLESNLDVLSAEFTRNRGFNESLIADLRARVAVIASGGSEQARARHVARDRAVPRHEAG